MTFGVNTTKDKKNFTAEHPLKKMQNEEEFIFMTIKRKTMILEFRN